MAVAGFSAVQRPNQLHAVPDLADSIVIAISLARLNAGLRMTSSKFMLQNPVLATRY